MSKDKTKLLKIALAITKNDDGEVLIVKRRSPEKGSDESLLIWSFPGGADSSRGKVDAYDSPEEAASEETLAETGHYVEAISLINRRKHPHFPADIFYFECKLTTNETTQLIMDDHIEQISWVNPSELKDYFTTDFDKKVAKHLGL